ncbi:MULTISPECIES: molybdate ABC transporter substrate-binding protein [unclassified Acinetobacter]|uniref:molybdate ABC transporter substrate-binding protein n=1 Tax=unclassified Acinetobacter TaxID=196816 RepID=UPI0015D221C0|nr:MULTISPECIES: molybdate ABC transporter substrate-binding protein [unclassified Acinetobacter]UUS62212.1 molybdate ABC transporter substrate-binding protein [Acinetobacter sp. YH16056_T]
MNIRLTFLTVLCCTASMVQAETVKIYAAASLTNAITDIAKKYQEQYPETKIVPVFGASSALAKQIEAGAPSDLYFSADVDWMNYLVKKQKIPAKQVVNMLSNDLVLITPKAVNMQFKAVPQFNFAKAFQGHLCTGQMESVPAGKYAKQSLTKLGWLSSLNGRIVGTDDVRSALAFVERGECQAGIVYRTDAMISQKVKIAGVFPNHTHQPIIYPLALTQQGAAKPEAVKFYRYLKDHAQSKMLFKHYGFGVKG